ncbi:hypothetical protein HRD49_37425 [Corallococcus exiguus]|uniref:Lipoprotein n=1 Tax=Corallococcus exiguus TaxID=83462 RepID=A0A7X5BYU5_9BACT|nr:MULTISPECIES: hypothetical protein [Corallococcus]NBC45722.1 hypothetical protein [Corallococcus exiguus]NNC15627.1 hypothetical protein [Corallococcus exiguus]NRD53369.1 hypothetical protein [Corallococcus exiguus]NRD67434.1 hypothetical protein [Corallococcus exiguus]RKH24597.1 hypothetical protein D7V77_20350 [Corallococcus sp. CA041A]
MSRLLLTLVLSALLAGCHRATFEDSVLRKSDVKYRVGPLSNDVWERRGFDDNDLAFVERGDTGRVIATNSTCRDHDDPSLQVLTKHLLMGFTERQDLGQRTFTLDDREALRSRYVAKLDGVPVSLELVVVKKDNCVFDFSYVAPVGAADARMADFESLFQGFRAERQR